MQQSEWITLKNLSEGIVSHTPGTSAPIHRSSPKYGKSRGASFGGRIRLDEASPPPTAKRIVVLDTCAARNLANLHVNDWRRGVQKAQAVFAARGDSLAASNIVLFELFSHVHETGTAGTECFNALRFIFALCRQSGNSQNSLFWVEDPVPNLVEKLCGISLRPDELAYEARSNCCKIGNGTLALADQKLQAFSRRVARMVKRREDAYVNRWVARLKALGRKLGTRTGRKIPTGNLSIGKTESIRHEAIGWLESSLMDVHSRTLAEAVGGVVGAQPNDNNSLLASLRPFLNVPNEFSKRTLLTYFTEVQGKNPRKKTANNYWDTLLCFYINRDLRVASKPVVFLTADQAIIRAAASSGHQEAVLAWNNELAYLGP